jgi:small subunit ribosomal protein S6
METETIKRNYEFAYHLSPDIPESEIRQKVDSLEKIVSSCGGGVSVSREPKMQRLSYPLKQKRFSFFSVMDFEASPETVEKINSQLKLENAILRYLIIQQLGDKKGLRVLGFEKSRPVKPISQPVARSEAGLENKQAETPPEQLEKEIEEVLEKI